MLENLRKSFQVTQLLSSRSQSSCSFCCTKLSEMRLHEETGSRARTSFLGWVIRLSLFCPWPVISVPLTPSSLVTPSLEKARNWSPAPNPRGVYLFQGIKSLWDFQPNGLFLDKHKKGLRKAGFPSRQSISGGPSMSVLERLAAVLPYLC